MRFRLLVIAVALIACARTPYFVRTGDEAYRRGDYARALNAYETEQRYRPTKELDDKIAATKAKLVEQELKPIESAFAEGRFDEGVTLLVQLDPQKQKQPAVQAFVKKQEKRLHDELAGRTGRKEWGRAFVLASRGRTVFPSLAEKLPEYGRNWADALRTAVADADKARNEAAGVFLRAALAIATGDRTESVRAKQALVALRAKYALALEVRGKGDVRGVQSTMSADHRFAMSSANSKAGKVIVTLGAPTDTKTTTRGREKTQVQKGTRAVENPQHRAAASHLGDKEEALASYKQQRADEMNSPSRTNENIEAYDYQISVAQADVDEAREDLRNTPATIQEPNYVDVPFEVETHTLTVSRDASVEVDAPWKRDLGAMRETVKVAKSDKAHAAIAEAGLARDPVELPAPAALAPELDRAVVTWLEGALTKVVGRYHGSLLDAMPRDQAVPLVIALSPKGARKADLAELEKALGVPMGDSLIDALASDRLAMAFDAPERPATTIAPAGSKAPTAVTPRPTPGSTTAAVAPRPAPGNTSPVTKPAAPTDPMLAKAGYALTVAPFTFTRAGKVVLEVDRDGTIRSGKTTIGVLRSSGVLEDPRGVVVLAIDKSGALWMPKQGAPAGKLSSGSLSFEAGATLSVDSAGHIRMKNPQGLYVTEAVLSPNTANVKPAAMIVAWVGVGKLGLRPER